MHVKVNRFRILIESRERSENSNINIGVINFFDLADTSEPSKIPKFKSIDKVKNIQNSSEVTSIIQALTDTHPLPLKETKLNRLLHPLFNGNSKIIMIFTLSPATEHIEESLNTIKLA